MLPSVQPLTSLQSIDANAAGTFSYHIGVYMLRDGISAEV